MRQCYYLYVAHPSEMLRRFEGFREDWLQQGLADSDISGLEIPGKRWVSPDLPYTGVEVLQRTVVKAGGDLSRFPTLLAFKDQGTVLLPTDSVTEVRLFPRGLVVGSAVALRRELALLKGFARAKDDPDESRQQLNRAIGVDPADPNAREKKWLQEVYLGLWTATGYSLRWQFPVWSNKQVVEDIKPAASRATADETAHAPGTSASSESGAADETSSKLWHDLEEWAFSYEPEIPPAEELSEAEADSFIDEAIQMVPGLDTAEALRSAARFFEAANFHGLVEPACRRAAKLGSESA